MPKFACGDCWNPSLSGSSSSSLWATRKQRRYIESCLERRKESLSFKRQQSVMKERKKMNRHMLKFGFEAATPVRGRRARANMKMMNGKNKKKKSAKKCPKKLASKMVWMIPDLVERILELVGAKDLCVSVRKLSHEFGFLISVRPRVDPRSSGSFLMKDEEDEEVQDDDRGEDEQLKNDDDGDGASQLNPSWFESLIARKYGIKNLFSVVYFFLHSPRDRKIHEKVTKLARDFTLTSDILCVCLGRLLWKVESGEVELNDVVMAYAHGLHKLSWMMLDGLCETKGLYVKKKKGSWKRKVVDRAKFRGLYREYAMKLQKHGFRGCVFGHEFEQHVLGSEKDDRDLKRFSLFVDGFEWPNRYTPVVRIEPVHGCDWEQRCCGVDAMLSVDPIVVSTSGGDGGLMLAMFDMLFDRRNPFERLSATDMTLRMRILHGSCHFSLAWGVEEAMELWKYQTVVYREACLWTIIAPPLLRENVGRARKKAMFMVSGWDAPAVGKNVGTKKVLRMVREALAWSKLMGLHVEFDRLKAHVSRQLKIKTSTRLEIREAISEFERFPR